MRTVRKLVLGETWVLPAGIACALAIAGAVRCSPAPTAGGARRAVGCSSCCSPPPSASPFAASCGKRGFFGL